MAVVVFSILSLDWISPTILRSGLIALWTIEWRCTIANTCFVWESRCTQPHALPIKRSLFSTAWRCVFLRLNRRFALWHCRRTTARSLVDHSRTRMNLAKVDKKNKKRLLKKKLNKCLVTFSVSRQFPGRQCLITHDEHCHSERAQSSMNRYAKHDLVFSTMQAKITHVNSPAIHIFIEISFQSIYYLFIIFNQLRSISLRYTQRFIRILIESLPRLRSVYYNCHEY